MGETTNQISDLEITDEAVNTSITGNQTSDAESPEEIRARIEQTRSELGDTLNALQEKLEPERLKEQAKEQIQEQVVAAKDSVKEATIGKARDVMQNVGDTISEAARPVVETVGQAAHTVGQTAHNVADSAKQTGSNVSSTVSSTGSSLMDTVRQNPLPAAMAAFGIGWLLLQNGKNSTRPNDYNAASRRHSWNQPPSWSSTNVGSGNGQASLFAKAGDTVGHTVENVQESAAHLTGQAAQQAHQVTERAQHKAHEAQDGLQRALQDNPLAVGAVALALGAAVGLSIPSTAPEGQLMGEAKEAVVDKATQAAQDTMGKVQEVAGRVVVEAGKAAKDVGQVAKDAAQEQGLTG